MKIIIAPDSYKESLTAIEVAIAIEAGFKKKIPDAQYIKLPMADGGEGTVQALIDASNGLIKKCTVTSPLGEPIQAFYGLLGDEKTAIIEMAAASGLHLVKPALRDPLLTTSYGTGELIKAVLNEGCTHIILGIGGSATNDAGIGMAQALGVKMLDKDANEIAFGGGAIASLVTIDRANIDPRLNDIKFEVACDVDNQLCGSQGATCVFATQKGASTEMIVQLDNNLNHYANLLKTQIGCSVKNSAGAGAAGGMGATLLALFNATLRPGIDIVIDAINLDQIVSDADLVITGEGRIDSQTIFGKTPIGVARTAKKYNIPVIAIAGCLANDANLVHDHGIDSVFSAVSSVTTQENALKDAAVNVENIACNIAALYQLR